MKLDLEYEPQDSYYPMFGYPVGRWFRVFAWRPMRTVDRGWVWLRMIYRRRIAKKPFLNGGADFWWQNAVDL